MIPFNRTCKEVSALVISREDRDLPWRERLALRIHMKLCDACPVFERQVLTMRSALRQWRSYQDFDAKK
jgi:hypothetical protein